MYRKSSFQDLDTSTALGLPALLCHCKDLTLSGLCDFEQVPSLLCLSLLIFPDRSLGRVLHGLSVPCLHSWKSRGVRGGNNLFIVGAKGGLPCDQPPVPTQLGRGWLRHPCRPPWGLPPADVSPRGPKPPPPFRQGGPRIQNFLPGRGLGDKPLVLAPASARRVPGVLPKRSWAHIPRKQDWQCRGLVRGLSWGWEAIPGAHPRDQININHLGLRMIIGCLLP